ncbi:hypothetical protein J3E68DRAFT_401026 [Trichoderma sp. SZMC 28012]
MLSAGILWITIVSILLCWTLHRIYNLPSHIPPKPLTTIEPASARLRRTVGSAIRHFLLRDSIRPIFGHTNRLQVTVLLSLIGYLIYLVLCRPYISGLGDTRQESPGRL